ncbi:MAG: hypothetical protein NTX45_06965 [Proteobacteria bacterium]|nr:hypothetical protein [Pseudomonadota bacterium]
MSASLQRQTEELWREVPYVSSIETFRSIHSALRALGDNRLDYLAKRLETVDLPDGISMYEVIAPAIKYYLEGYDFQICYVPAEEPECWGLSEPMYYGSGNPDHEWPILLSRPEGYETVRGAKLPKSTDL